MPELPEVETVRRGLVHARLREPVVSIWRSEQSLRIGAAWRREHEHLDRLIGTRPGRLRRRGKYLLWTFTVADAADWTLLLHLGMTGRCDVVTPEIDLLPHTHLRLGLACQRELRFVDPRRFGGLRVDRARALERAPPLSELGPEPLARGFDGARLAQRGGRSRRPIRDVLLDQRVVAGVGNIYAVEVLYAARIHPLRSASDLGPLDWDRVARCLVELLRTAIRNKGTTLRDYRRPGGAPGRHATRLRVYGREGERCTTCGTVLVGFTSGGRRGVFCPHEQPAS
ncbi:MAG: bifunctional DNA-formamidopyrimidine glycosylase/DNA-(apurinic or apyrimidinic site) lyase [Myxococcales bacterium FL481]|nr:MAG: bifunctional DNA-formamidopyrimidine glycosylase/DNA-(apurinic or apyrimidinic site) lyase [Myxococcales bacterium FL481]